MSPKTLPNTSGPPKKPPKTARFAAIEVLCRLQLTKRPIKPLLDAVAEECRLPANERALAMNLAYGVLRRRDCLALLIGRLCRHPLNRLEPFVHHALEVGLFQLFLLDRIPASAAVNETVNALKSSRLPRRLQGFVNGILRESIRQGPALSELIAAPLADGTCLNHPSWLTARWRRHFGEAEMRRICARNNLEPLLVLRVNTARVTQEDFCLRLSEQGIAWRHGGFAPEAVVLPEYPERFRVCRDTRKGSFSSRMRRPSWPPCCSDPFCRRVPISTPVPASAARPAILPHWHPDSDCRSSRLSRMPTGT